MLSEDLAEFIGALLGDGCLSEYFVKSENRQRYEIAFTGSKTDFPYYENFLQPILQKEFGMKGRLFIRKDDGSSRFHIKSKRLFYFLKDLEIQVGKKDKNLSIPKPILEDNNLSLACIRGIYNTDGCICLRYSKKYSNHKRFYGYYKIQLKMNAEKLLCQVKEILNKNNILTGTILKSNANSSVLVIHKQASVTLFLKLIGFSNKHHLDRINRLGLNIS